MLSYILRRSGYMLVTLVIVAFLGYAVVELAPGSFVEYRIEQLRQQGGNLTTDQIDALYRRYGLNDPVYVRFWKWISGFVVGDFGQSFQYDLPVKDMIWSRLGYTVLISLFSLIFSWTLAIFIGVYSATHRYTVPDYIITTLQFIGLSVPGFLLALILMVFAQQVLGQEVGGLFSQEYQNAPWSFAKFMDFLGHMWIPIIVLGASGTAGLSRIMRANLLDVMGMQYIQTARAKGLHENVVTWKHAVRNAMHPLIMALGGALPGLINGEVLIAIVLNLQTTGPLYFQALIQKDMYLAVTFLMFLAIMLVIGNLLADVLLAWVDPRIRYE